MKSMPLRKMLISACGLEVEILPFLHVCTDKVVKIARKCVLIDQMSYHFCACTLEVWQNHL